MHFVVSFGLNVGDLFGRKFAHADALDPVVELPVDTAADGAHERTEVEDD
jgi:hypothetical protein